MPSSFLQGISVGAGIGQGWVRNRQLKAQEAERQLRERQLSKEIELLDLKNQEIKREIAQRAQQDAEWADTVSVAQAEDKLMASEDLNSISETGVLDRLIPRAQTLAATNPHAQQFLKSYQEFELKQAQADYNRERNRGGSGGSFRTDALLRSIEEHKAIGDDETVAALTAELNKERVKQEQNATRIGIAKEHVGLRTTGLKQAAVRTQAQLQEQGFETDVDLMPGMGAEAETSAETDTHPAPSSTLRRVERPATTAVVTDNQKGIQADEIALGTLGEALNFVITRPEAFGPQGKLAEAAERARSIATGGKGKMPITEARQAALRNFITMADGLRVDSGNMNQKELELLKQAGDVRGFLDDPGLAKIKLQGLTKLKLQQMKKRYDVLKREPPAELMKSLNDEALIDAVIIGLFPEEKAQAEYNRRHRK